MREDERYNDHNRDDRKERDRAREAKRERERQEKRVIEEKQRQKKAEEIQEKINEQASLMNVEELLTDFNWKASGNAAALEKRLLGELHALEAVSATRSIYKYQSYSSILHLCRLMCMLSFNLTSVFDPSSNILIVHWRNWTVWKAGYLYTAQSLT